MVFDFGETSEIDTIIMVDSSRDSFGVSTVTLELNATSDFSSPAFSVSVPLNIKFGLGLAEFPVESYRFARLVMTSTDDYCELSNVFIGKSISFDNGMGIDIGWSFNDRDLATSKENRYGQKFTDKIARRRNFNFSLNAMNPDEFDQVLEVIDHKGLTDPFFVRIGDDEMINDPERFTAMVYLDKIPTVTNIAYGLWGLQMGLEEAM